MKFRQCQELEVKLQQVIQRLKDDGVEYPEMELFRKKITNFYNETVSPDLLADNLYQNGVLSLIQKDEIIHEVGAYKRNRRLYDIVLNKREVFKLLDALKKSGNENVLEIIEALVLEKLQDEYQVGNELKSSTSSRQARTACKMRNGANTRVTSTGLVQIEKNNIKIICRNKNSMYTGSLKRSNEDRIEFNTRDSIISFKGREEFLKIIHLELEKPTSINQTLSKVIVITGLPGMGKTETVRKYIELHKTSYGHIIWINAEKVDAAKENFSQLAEKIKIHTKDKSDTHLIDDIYDSLTKKNILVIYDGADDYDQCKDLLPRRCMSGRHVPAIMVTSRNNTWDHFKVVKHPEFTVEDCLSLLAAELDLISIEANEEQVKEITKVCAGLPILIQQVVSIMKYEKDLSVLMNLPVYTMGALLQDLENSMSKLLTPIAEGEFNGYSIFKTVFDRLENTELGGWALKCLDVMSLLNPDHIPKHLFSYLMAKYYDPKGNMESSTPPTKQRNRFSNFQRRLYHPLKLLLDYNMITDCSCFYKINRIVQAIKLEELNTTNDSQYDLQNLVNSFHDYLVNVDINDPNLEEILDNGRLICEKAERLGKVSCTHLHAILATKKIALEELSLE